MQLRYILQTIVVACLLMAAKTASAGEAGGDGTLMPSSVAPDSTAFIPDSTLMAESALTHADSMKFAVMPDTVVKRHKRDWNTWRPNAKRGRFGRQLRKNKGQIPHLRDLSSQLVKKVVLPLF